MSYADETVTLTRTELCEFAFTVAGAASAPFMMEPPYPVMPTEKIGKCVSDVLAEWEIDVTQISGYESAADG